MSFFDRLGVSSDFDSTNSLVTSPIVRPFTLAVIRLTFAVYSLLTIIVSLAWQSAVLGTGSTYLTYFSDLAYIGLCAYFWASGVQSFAYAIGRNTKNSFDNGNYPLRRWPQFLQLLHGLLLSSVVTFAILITVLYWAVLSSSQSFDNPFNSWYSISYHILNTTFVLFEILFTNMQPLPLAHLPFLVIILACYLGLAYLTYQTQHYFVYDFLDPQTEHGALAGWIVGIAAAEIVVFVIIHSVCIIRERIFARYGGKSPVKKGADAEKLEDWVTISEQGHDHDIEEVY